MVLQVPRPFKKPETGVYYFRRIVPELLRKLVGTAEVRRSLRTKDPKVAARRFTEVAASVAREWAALQRGPSPDALARQFVADRLDPDSRQELAQDLSEVDYRAAGYLDDMEPYAHDVDWTPPPRTLATQRAVRRLLESRGLATDSPDPRPAKGAPGGR
jgi:hypothetical protein